jgi:chromosome segregation ATPase
MKKTFFIKSSLLVALVLLAACKSEKSGNLNETDARIDSLQKVIEQKDNEMNDVMATFNEIQEGFRLIEQAENTVSLMKTGEQSDRAEQIRMSIRNIQQNMQHNRELISRLQQQVREGSMRSEQMRRAIENLTQQLNDKNQELQHLRAQLEEKDIHIAELDKTVEELNVTVNNLEADSHSKQEKINTQDAQLNTAYYVFGTKKELQTQNIYQKGKVLRSNFNRSYFTKIDIREVKEIKLYSKDAELLTTHPAGSYTLQPDAQKQYVLRITNPQQFWSTSKYLVILVK